MLSLVCNTHEREEWNIFLLFHGKLLDSKAIFPIPTFCRTADSVIFFIFIMRIVLLSIYM